MESYTRVWDDFFRFKVRCRDCKKICSFTRAEFTGRAFRPRCLRCGSIALDVIETSEAKAKCRKATSQKKVRIYIHSIPTNLRENKNNLSRPKNYFEGMIVCYRHTKKVGYILLNTSKESMCNHALRYSQNDKTINYYFLRFRFSDIEVSLRKLPRYISNKTRSTNKQEKMSYADILIGCHLEVQLSNSKYNKEILSIQINDTIMELSEYRKKYPLGLGIEDQNNHFIKPDDLLKYYKTIR